MRTVSIPRRFCGPPQSANGGWTAGLLATEFGGAAPAHAVEVTLAAPPPLDRPLQVLGDPVTGPVELRDGPTLIATARRADPPTGPVPVPLPVDESAALMARSPMLADPSVHPFPECFVCGPARRPDDGLRLFPAEVPGLEVFTAVYVPRETECTLPYTWAALDCPSSFPMYLARDPFPGPLVLGRMTASLERDPVAGEALVITAWRESAEGRKLSTQVAMHDRAGALVGRAAAVWIRLRPTS